jgi:hypothetical protein
MLSSYSLKRLVVFLGMIFNFCFSGSSLIANPTLWKTYGYYTHQPVLFKIATQSNGPIIEFGCGYGSTDMLHEICKDQDRLLITLDDSFPWLNQFARKYRSSKHQFIFVPGKNLENPEDHSHWIRFFEKHPSLKERHFGLCFIDQSPWLARFETVKRMKGNSQYVIVHDCDYFPMANVFGKVIKPIVNRQDGVFDFSDVFRFFKVYFPPQPWVCDTGPPTLLGSDFEADLPDIDFNAP